MDNIRNRLGLGYLRMEPSSERATEESRASSRFKEEAILIFAPRALQVLKESPDGKVRVFGIVERLKEPVTVLNPVIDYLEAHGYVDVLESDLRGDREIKITERGVKIVG